MAANPPHFLQAFLFRLPLSPYFAFAHLITTFLQRQLRAQERGGCDASLLDYAPFFHSGHAHNNKPIASVAVETRTVKCTGVEEMREATAARRMCKLLQETTSKGERPFARDCHP